MVREKTVVGRRRTSGAPADAHIAPIESILVDLYLETNRLGLMDIEELQAMARRLVTSSRVEIASLIAAAERRKQPAEDILGNLKSIISNFSKSRSWLIAAKSCHASSCISIDNTCFLHAASAENGPTSRLKPPALVTPQTWRSPRIGSAPRAPDELLRPQRIPEFDMVNVSVELTNPERKDFERSTERLFGLINHIKEVFRDELRDTLPDRFFHKLQRLALRPAGLKEPFRAHPLRRGLAG